MYNCTTGMGQDLNEDNKRKIDLYNSISQFPCRLPSALVAGSCGICRLTWYVVTDTSAENIRRTVAGDPQRAGVQSGLAGISCVMKVRKVQYYCNQTTTMGWVPRLTLAQCLSILKCICHRLHVFPLTILSLPLFSSSPPPSLCARDAPSWKLEGQVSSLP